MMDDQDDFAPPASPLEVKPRSTGNEDAEAWAVLVDAGRVLLLLLVLAVVFSL